MVVFGSTVSETGARGTPRLQGEDPELRIGGFTSSHRRLPCNPDGIGKHFVPDWVSARIMISKGTLDIIKGLFMKEYLPPYCDECRKEYKSKEELRSYMRTVHQF